MILVLIVFFTFLALGMPIGESCETFRGREFSTYFVAGVTRYLRSDLGPSQNSPFPRWSPIWRAASVG